MGFGTVEIFSVVLCKKSDGQKQSTTFFELKNEWIRAVGQIEPQLF